MSAAQAQARGSGGPLAFLTSGSPIGLIVRLALIAAADALALLLAVSIIGDGNWFLGIVILLTAAGLTIINLKPDLWPLRWMSPALGFIALLAVYPLLYTVYVAFTNFSDGHRYTRIEAIQLIGQRKFLPEGGISYRWSVFRADDGQYALWLTAPDGQAFFALQGEPLRPVAPNTGSGPFNDDGIPLTVDGYQLLEGGERFRALNDIQGLQFGEETDPIGIRSRNEAGAFQQKWVWDASQNALVDRETNTPYFADDSQGSFVAPNGDTAPIGYWVPIGFSNFTRIFTSPLIAGPLARVFAWTFAFAFLSVASAFAVGLVIALVLNKDFTGVRVIRSLLIIPYAIPGMISILIWRGMLNPNMGVITTNLQQTFGWAPPWFSDPGWAKVGVLLVNLWLAYPYFMLVCSGALQSISTTIYEAAEVDGANRWQRFWNLTLPLLLVAVGPLLVASFTFNFNNFLLIEALFQGGPPMIGTSAPPVGHTDNLISYTFRFAFGTGGTRDYGFASAIAIIIFIIVGAITLLQFRFTRRLEEISENV